MHRGLLVPDCLLDLENLLKESPLPSSADTIQAFEVGIDRLGDTRAVSEPLSAPAPCQELQNRARPSDGFILLL